MADKIESASSDAAEKAYEAAASTVVAKKPAVEPVTTTAELAPMAKAPVAKPVIAEVPTPVEAAPVVKKAPVPAPAKKAVTPKPTVKKAPASKAPTPKMTARKPAAVAAKTAKPAPVKKPVAKKPTTPTPATKPAKAPAKAAIPTQPTVSNLKDFIMATASKKSDYTKMFSDTIATVKDKAKVAYEKGSAAVGEFGEFTKGNVEAAVEAGKILASGAQEMGRTYVEETKGAFETATADMKKFAAIKSPTELYQLQGELLRRNFDSAVAFGSKSSEQMVKLANEAFAPISTRFSILAEKVSKAA